MRKLGVRDQKLLKKAQRHTHICAGCFPLWISTHPHTTTKFKLNRNALNQVLSYPPDDSPFEKHGRMWYHACCWDMLQAIEATK